jgi:hypothetical protein
MDPREIVWDGVDWMMWLRLGTSGGLLWTLYWNFRFIEYLRISWVAERLVASQEELRSMGLASSAINDHCLRKKIHFYEVNLYRKIGQSMASRKLLLKIQGI